MHARYIVGLAPCTHEEAYTRMLLHVEDAMKQGYAKVSIRTVDTDVVVLALAGAECLRRDELWVAFGSVMKKENYDLSSSRDGPGIGA